MTDPLYLLLYYDMTEPIINVIKSEILSEPKVRKVGEHISIALSTEGKCFNRKSLPVCVTWRHLSRTFIMVSCTREIVFEHQRTPHQSPVGTYQIDFHFLHSYPSLYHRYVGTTDWWRNYWWTCGYNSRNCTFSTHYFLTLIGWCCLCLWGPCHWY